MSDERKGSVFGSILAGLEDAVAHARGAADRARVREVRSVDVGAARRRLGLTQAEFARVFGVSVATVRNWEQHRREPDGPAKVLLTVIEKEPEAVVRALHIEAKSA